MFKIWGLSMASSSWDSQFHIICKPWLRVIQQKAASKLTIRQERTQEPHLLLTHTIQKYSQYRKTYEEISPVTPNQPPQINNTATQRENMHL